MAYNYKDYSALGDSASFDSLMNTYKSYNLSDSVINDILAPYKNKTQTATSNTSSATGANMSFNLSDPSVIAAAKQLKSYMDSTNPTEAARIYAEKKSQLGFTDADFNSAVGGGATTQTNTQTNTTPSFDTTGLVPIYGNSGMDQSSGTGENATWTQGEQTGWGKELPGRQVVNYDMSGKETYRGDKGSGLFGNMSPGQIALLAGGAMVGGGLAANAGLFGGAAGVDYSLTSGLGAASGGTAAGTGAGGGLVAGSGGLGLTTGGGLGLTAGGLTAGAAGAAAAGTGGSLGTGLTAGGSGLGLCFK